MASFIDRFLSYGPERKVLTADQAARSVVVSNISPQTTAENIVIHFQRQKNGGGEIDHVHIPEKGTAIVTFESSEGLLVLLTWYESLPERMLTKKNHCREFHFRRSLLPPLL